MKNKALFHILSLTWGLPMTLIGAAVALIMLAKGHKPKRWRGCVYFTTGGSWGGISLGLFILTSKDNEGTKSHELGHSIQNVRYGPLMPFIVGIPSAARYLYREIRYHRKGLTPPTAYDAVWFEREATELGKRYT